MARYTETDVADAKKEVESGLSIRKAARLHGIPEASLRLRLKGAKAHKAGAEHLQVLSPKQEADLVAWITIQAQIGLAPTQSQICAVAERLATAAGCPRSLGTTWKRKFLARHPELKSLRRPSGEDERANNDACE